MTTDGRAFIEAYDSFKPTTIILDMIMPGMDGNEIVLWLAQAEMHGASDHHHRIHAGLRGPRQGAGGVQGSPAGDNVAQADRSQRASSRVGLARILLELGSPRKPGTRSYRVGRVAWANTNASLCSSSSSSVRC